MQQNNHETQLSTLEMSTFFIKAQHCNDKNMKCNRTIIKQ